MAMQMDKNSRQNVYAELFSSLPVPERLSPENIKLMLDANVSAELKRSEIKVGTAASKIESYETKKTNIKTNSRRPVKKLTTVYRAVASVAACAVLALGVVRYFDAGTALDADSGVKGSAYAGDYDHLHQIFRTYYVDDSDKKTLDSAIAEIEHSYNEAQGNSSTNKVDTPVPPVNPDDTPDVTAPVPDNTQTNTPDPVVDNPAVEDPVYSGIDLPEFSANPEPDNVIIADKYIFVRDGSTIKVISTSGGQMEYIGDAVPEKGIFETKVLDSAYAVGDKLCAVYTVINEEPLSIPAYGEENSIVDGIVNGIYTDNVETVKTKSVEVVIYEVTSSGIVPAMVTSQNGTLIDVKESGGYVYVITDYDDYRRSPLIGVDDLESYVPSYTVNGIKQFIRPENILVPEYISTTDYTVISGIAVGVQGSPVLVQAVLGSEGKVIATDKSVYVFGYSDGMGVEKTVCERLSHEFGSAQFVGSTSIEGIAVNGGIYENNGTLFVTTLRNTENGYVTRVSALGDSIDGGLSLISYIDVPAAVNQVSFESSKVFLTNGTDNYAADFTNPASPVQIDYSDNIDVTSGLVAFGDGYVTLTKTSSGGIKLEKIVSGQDESLTRTAGITVCEESAVSKALSDNSIMYTDPVNGYVGVPYGYFDGYDYCYKYELFRLTAEGFVRAGHIESHETEDAFEFGRARLAGGMLYIFSEGRIYSTALGDGTLSVVSSADLIESSYSGHTTW